jgi:hypothetical protein
MQQIKPSQSAEKESSSLIEFASSDMPVPNNIAGGAQ